MSNASQVYLERISNLCTRFPNLTLLNKTLSAAQPTIRGRIIVLEFISKVPDQLGNTDTNVISDYVSSHEFLCPGELAAYLNAGPNTGIHYNYPYPSRLFLVEDLVPAFINTLGEHFEIDPAFFAGHLASANWLGTVEEGGATPRLPSSIPKISGFKGQKFWTLMYYEILLFNDLEGLKGHREIFRDANVYRKVHFGGAAVEGIRCGIAHSNASFWSRSRGMPVGDWLGAPIGWDGTFVYIYSVGI